MLSAGLRVRWWYRRFRGLRAPGDRPWKSLRLSAEALDNHMVRGIVPLNR